MANLLRRALRKGLNGSWDVDRLRAPLLGMSSMRSDREQIETDFEGYVQGIYKRSGPVFALMMTRMLLFSEARLMYRRIRAGRPGDLFSLPDLDILRKPWPGGTTGDLLSQMIVDADLAGNAYVTVVNGRIRRLRPDWVTIVTGSRSQPELYGAALDAELLGYIYTPYQLGSVPRGWPSTATPGDLSEGTFLLPDQVAHFRPIPDPDANFRGMSWLTPVLREVSSDNAATLHKKRFFENGATPQIVASVDANVRPDDFRRFIAMMDERHQGVDNAYKTMYLGGGADVTVAGADLKQIDFKATQGAGESRLAAAAGVPPTIVGFSEGLAGSSLNAGNYAASRRRLSDGTMRPLWRNLAGSLASIVHVPGDAELWYDDRDIAFLREDRSDVAQIQQAQAQTIRALVDAGYDAESVVAAVQAEDWGLLTHTGLFSVQLQPPGTTPPGGTDPQVGG